MTTIIAAEEVCHWYGQILGVNDLTATVVPGITGLLGPNGAGKSTFLKLVTGQIKPTRGRIEVLGLRPFANRELYRRLGYCPEHESLYDEMTGRQFVRFCMRLHGYSARVVRQRADAAIERVGLADAADRSVAGYSKGMRQRVKLAQAIAHDPELLIVDEPMTGLDPLARLQFLELFRDLARRGVHIVISSHVLHEIEVLTEKILLIHRGRILAEGTVPEIRTLLDRYPRRVRIRARRARELGREVWEIPGTISVRVETDALELVVETRDLRALEAGLPAIVGRVRPGISLLEETDSNMEAVFDYLVG